LTFFGPRGENGAIVIRTKTYEAAHPVMMKDDAKPAGVITMNGESHSEGNGQSIGVANGPREGQAQVIFDNGKQVAIADTIKMNGVIITTYHAGGN
jgi:hypothetical protein